MWTPEKVNEKIKTLEASVMKASEYKFIINEKPEAYARERKGRGKHFYNPKGAIIERYRKTMLKQLSKEEKDYIKNIIENEVSYVELYCDFYIPIPKNDSIITAAKKELKQILPAQRPDIDNYQKLLLDALHEVVYSDDCNVVKIVANKYFSMNPRTEVRVVIQKRKD